MKNGNNYVILIPPSEGKKIGGDESKIFRIVKNLKQYNFFKSLWIEREKIETTIKEAITKLPFEEIEQIFELKTDKLQRAIEINEDILNEATMPSIERYSGVMYNSINYEKLEKNQQENFNKSIIIIDAMFGILKPQDFIPEYKLKITSKFLNINITKFWKENLYGILSSEFKEKIVIDLLPEAHRKVISYNENNETKYIKIKFCEFKDKILSNIGHNSKQLKGELIQYLVKKENISINYLKEFKHSKGYKFDETNSNEKEIIYTKIEK